MNKLLHTPLTVHNVKLANRLVMPPMATGKTPDGTVQDDLLAYYDARSKGGCIGLIVTEHAYISPEGKAHEGQLSVSRDTDIPGLTKLVETIHKNNTHVIAQINHAGSAAMEEITGYPAISASVTAQPEYARKSEKPVLILSGPAATLAYIISGIPFDLVHGVSNFLLAFLLLPTLRRILARLTRLLNMGTLYFE